MNSTRREFLRQAGTHTLLAGIMARGMAHGEDGMSSRRPNVVVINIDNLDESVLGCYGNTFIETPNIDSLASQALILSNHVSVGRCSPSRASLMTGRQSLRTGVIEVANGHQILQRSEKTLGDHFKQAGYTTAMIGKWHLGNNYPYRPEDRGFDEVLTYFASYSPRTPDQFRLRHNGHWKSFTGFRGKPWFDHAVSFIENNASHPFLLYLATSMVHAPNLGPEDLYDKYRKKLQAAGQMEAALEEKSRQLNGKYEGDRLVEMANRYVSMTIHLYAEIDFIDQGVGRILKTLERGNLRENTIVVFCSDGSGSKAFSFHVRPDDRSRPQNTEYAHPCLIDWPAAGWRKGLRVLERTANFDILPTLLDLCGAKPTADVKLDGQSFRSLLEEDPRGWSGRYFIMDDTSHYSPVSGWPVIRLMPLFETSVLSPNGGFASWRNGELVEQAGLSPKELVQAKAHFLDFWTQAMYEYEPYKYFIAGTRHENPMVIPNHYWVPVPDPHSTGPHPVRYCWPIEFTRDGSYAIEFWRIEDTSYVPEKAPTVYPGAHTGRLRIGRRQFDWKASEDGGVPHFDIDVQSGRYLVDATINPETDPVPSQCLMVRWVER